MDNHLVQIGQAHFFQGHVDGPGGFLVGLPLRRRLAGHEQRFPWHAAGVYAFAHAPLVAVGLGRINQPVAQSLSM